MLAVYTTPRATSRAVYRGGREDVTDISVDECCAHLGGLKDNSGGRKGRPQRSAQPTNEKKSGDARRVGRVRVCVLSQKAGQLSVEAVREAWLSLSVFVEKVKRAKRFECVCRLFSPFFCSRFFSGRIAALHCDSLFRFSLVCYRCYYFLGCCAS